MSETQSPYGNAESIGELRVRTKFNPDANGTVDQIKQKTAELINLLESLRTVDGGIATYPADKEVQRCISCAQTAYEEAAMWAVKAATA